MIVIGALVEKEAGLKAYDDIHTMNGVEYVFVETARSDDLFDNKQFGDFGESASNHNSRSRRSKDQIIDALYYLCGLQDMDIGNVFVEDNMVRSTLPN